MSRQEASWHEHLAGMRAAEKARAQGGNPAAIDAVAAATCGPVRIGAFEIYPPTEGTVWTLKRLAREFAAWADALGMPSAADGEDNGSREMLELGLSTLAFVDSRQTFQYLEAGRLEDLILRAEKLMWETPVEVTKQLSAHFESGMARLRELNSGDEEAPKKPIAADGNGVSPAMPIPPAVADSPSSSGSLRNTGCPSKQPSGAPRWP